MADIFDYDYLRQLINSFSLSQKPKPNEFSLTGGSAPEPFNLPEDTLSKLSGGKKTNWPEVIKGMSLAIGALSMINSQRQKVVAPPVSLGAKPMAQMRYPYQTRPLGFRSILGGRQK